MSNFEKIYKEASKFYPQRQSVKLKELLQIFYENCIRNPIDLSLLKISLVSLLEFISSPEGRTQENLGITDLFVCLKSDWEVDIDTIPESYLNVIEDIGGALHDTIKNPDIALMFDSTPEILLARAKELTLES